VLEKKVSKPEEKEKEGTYPEKGTPKGRRKREGFLTSTKGTYLGNVYKANKVAKEKIAKV